MLTWMVYVLVVTLILSGAALSAERAMRLRRGPTRWIWVVAIVGSLVIPTTIASVSVQLPNIVAPTGPQKTVVLREITSLPLSAIERLPATSRYAIGSRHLTDFLRRIWLTASLAMLFVLSVSAAQVFWRKRRWAISTVAGASVYVSPDIGPAVVGLIRPRIVVPAWVAESPAPYQTLVISHEQSHLQARDPLLLTVGVCLLVFMPWNLPLWWHLRRLRRAIEIDCDSRVLRAGHDLSRYCEALIEAGRRQSAFIGSVAAMSESKSFLEQRLTIMLGKHTRWWKLSAAVLGGLSVCLIAVATQVSPPNAGAQSGERTAIALDPAVYDGYVGHYKFAETAVMTVSRDGAHFLTRLTGQGPVEIFPQSPTEFFAKMVNAQLTFETDGEGHATALVLHQNGQNHTAPRMDDAAAQQIESALSAKVQSQTPTPGSEAALRRLIPSLCAGKPIYDEMSPALADATRTQLPNLQSACTTLGAVQSVEFRGVGMQGWDVYDVRHEKGMSTWRISLADGKIAGALFNIGP